MLATDASKLLSKFDDKFSGMEEDDCKDEHLNTGANAPSSVVPGRVDGSSKVNASEDLSGEEVSGGDMDSSDDDGVGGTNEPEQEKNGVLESGDEEDEDGEDEEMVDEDEEGEDEEEEDGEGDEDEDDDGEEEEEEEEEEVEMAVEEAGDVRRSSSPSKGPAQNAPPTGPGRGRRRCPECSSICKANQPTCFQCGKRFFTPGRKRRGVQGGWGTRRVKRKRLSNENPVAEVEVDDLVGLSRVPYVTLNGRRRWRKFCFSCQMFCSAEKSKCPTCGSEVKRNYNYRQPSTSAIDDEDDSAKRGSLRRRGQPSSPENGAEDEAGSANGSNNEEEEAEDGADNQTEVDLKDRRRRFCRPCNKTLPPTALQCPDCGQPVKRKYRRRAPVVTRQPTSRRRAALVARATTLTGTPRHRQEVEEAQSLLQGDASVKGSKWCSRCQKFAMPLVTHCPDCGKELKRIYRKRSSIWQHQQVQQQLTRRRALRSLGASDLGSSQRFPWSRPVTSLVHNRTQRFVSSSPTRPVVYSDRLSVDGDRAVTRGTELVQHVIPTLTPGVNFNDLTCSPTADFDRPLSPSEVEFVPRMSLATEQERELITQCMLDIKMAIPQHDMADILSNTHQRHQVCLQKASNEFDDVDREYYTEKECCETLAEQLKTLKQNIEAMSLTVETTGQDVVRLQSLEHETSHQVQLFRHVVEQMDERHQACSKEIAEFSTSKSSTSATASTNPNPSSLDPSNSTVPQPGSTHRPASTTGFQQPIKSLKEQVTLNSTVHLDVTHRPTVNGTAVAWYLIFFFLFYIFFNLFFRIFSSSRLVCRTR